MNELAFLAGKFFDFDLPRGKEYLFRYFTTDIEIQFLRYYYCFGQVDYFRDHTGMYCHPYWLQVLKDRHDLLVKVHDEAKREMDLEALAAIETGKYSLKEIKGRTGQCEK